MNCSMCGLPLVIRGSMMACGNLACSTNRENQYRPWESEGITEADYFKARYIEVRVEVAALKQLVGRLATELQAAMDMDGFDVDHPSRALVLRAREITGGGEV